MSLKRSLQRLAVLLLFVFTAAGHATEAKTKGYNCLFMGHSFFAPIAKEFAALPNRCGFPEHKQTIVFHGSQSGSPGELWKSPAPDVIAAKKQLETGTVDLVGLTFYPNVGSELSDYRQWVDLALKFNPGTRFIIQAPWAKYEDKTFAAYEADSEKWLEQIHSLVEQLRRAYPGIPFDCIPQGRWMVGLWRLFDEKGLPEVSVLKRASKEAQDPCLFLDTLGHGGLLPVKDGALLWLAVIYGVDPRNCDYDTKTKADLKGLAWSIVQGDPYTGVSKAK